MPNEGYVYFGLGGEFDPVEVTEVIGLAPTEARKVGDKYAGRLVLHSSWKYSGDKVVGLVDVYDQSKLIIEKLVPYEQRIALAVERFKLTAVLQVVLNISPDPELSTPAIGFDEEVVRFLARVGAGIDIDTYKTS